MSQRQPLILICGNAGVGKTTLGRKLAQEKRAVLLDIDTVSERLVVAGLRAAGRDPFDRDSPEYKLTYREAIHKTLFAIADENLDHLPCVIVAPFTQERRRVEFLAETEQKMRTSVEVIVVSCREDERRARIEKRMNPRDAAKLESWDEYVKVGRDPRPPPFKHTSIDTSDG